MQLPQSLQSPFGNPLLLLAFGSSTFEAVGWLLKAVTSWCQNYSSGAPCHLCHSVSFLILWDFVYLCDHFSQRKQENLLHPIQ